MLSEESIKSLEKQQYRIVGNHSAVKTCGWTKKMMKDQGGCYKLKFYGIKSSQCLQMTTSISCPNRCTFCWRDYKSPVSKEWTWPIDDPKLIFEESKKAHLKLLVGFKGNEKVSDKDFKTSTEIKHVALSLTGEPIMYPKLNELIDLFHKDKISTFLVTNAQYPEQIKNLKPITQLYLSLDAPNKEILKEVTNPLFSDYWERLNKSLEHLDDKKQRTCIRLTLIKNINMINPEEYAELIKKGSADFIEVKAYMYVGASKERLKQENMPYHEEVVNFSKELLKYLPDYSIVSEHTASRVVMLAKNKFKVHNKWYTWINFERFNELVNDTEDFYSVEYLDKLPESYYFGKAKTSLERTSQEIKINEKTKELEFWN